VAKLERQVDEAQLLKSDIRRMRQRFVALQHRPSTTRSEWRGLQYDLLSLIVEGQRRFVSVHQRIIATIRSDRDPRAVHRIAAVEAFCILDELHAMLRAVEDAIKTSDTARQ
jgi:hypothetical protein